MSNLDNLLLALFRRLSPEDQDFVNAMAASMLVIQKKGAASPLPITPKEEA